MPIPIPQSSETEQDYVSRCIEESKLGQQEYVYSKLRELHYRGIDLTKLAEEDGGLEGACWSGYEAIGMKVLDGRLVPNCVPIKE